MKHFLKLAAIATLSAVSLGLLSGCIKTTQAEAMPQITTVQKMKNGEDKTYKVIYLAGGCFWGVEKYMSLIDGVVATDVGYANGNTDNPTYDSVCRDHTGYAEAVRVAYDPKKVSLAFVLKMFYEVVDPTSLNKQGNDVGRQYRAGVYFVDPKDESVIQKSVKELAKKYKRLIVLEVVPIKNYFLAEEYHQKYLDKNPNGYCHIGKDKFKKATDAKDTPQMEQKYEPKADDILQKELTPMQFKVTRENATEPPFKNEYWDEKREGIYVDITSGEPLFSSQDKFDSGSGWPSFTQPITLDVLKENTDKSHGMNRTEVRSNAGDAHLGHLFNDGPREAGGMRYCINSASLRFIPKDKMEAEGYGHLLPKLDKANK